MTKNKSNGQSKKIWNEVPSSEYWNPETQNESIEGELIDIVEGNFGKQYAIKNLENGKIILTPSHKVLQSQMATVKIGNVVKLVFVEEIPNVVKGRSATKMYKIYIQEEEKEEEIEEEHTEE